jgi:hypothetical protein
MDTLIIPPYLFSRPLTSFARQTQTGGEIFLHLTLSPSRFEIQKQSLERTIALKKPASLGNNCNRAGYRTFDDNIIYFKNNVPIARCIIRCE